MPPTASKCDAMPPPPMTGNSAATCASRNLLPTDARTSPVRSNTFTRPSPLVATMASAPAQ